MTIHSSLRGVNALTGGRSVLTRVERIQKLQKDGKFDAERSSVWGLPKVRTHFKVAGAKKAKAAAPAEGVPAEGAVEAAPAAPAAEKPAGKGAAKPAAAAKAGKAEGKAPAKAPGKGKKE